MSNHLKPSLNQDQLVTQNYSRDDIQAGVLHLGVGAFHRAHQAVYFDRLLTNENQQNWGIIGVNIRPQDSQAFARFVEQDGEYVLKTIAADGITKYEHIRSLVKQIDGAQAPDDVDTALASESIQLVTSTVTEGGYYLDENRGLMLDHPAIKADIAGDRNTLYAFLYAGLKKRSETSNAKITLLCCDNLRHNGELLEAGLIQFIAAKQDTNLVNWVKLNASFPCSMVDRITPKPSQQHADDVQTRFGVDDKMTVMSEDFIQWVVEDKFAGKKPSLDLVGVQLVKDVVPFEEAKIRILNASHTCLSYKAALKGFTYFDEAACDAELKQYYIDFTQTESIPSIGHSDIDLRDYRSVVLNRFSNKNVGDTVERICSEGYTKITVFLIPIILSCYSKSITPIFTISAIANWFHFLQEVKKGRFNYQDQNIDKLINYNFNKEDIKSFTTDVSLWGAIIKNNPEFSTTLSNEIEKLGTLK
ncbi:mannitol dehydrogenase family protein [Marinomonas primoryensis]|uniref:mannitol dehydrogenase family protein n=1 Tax=Marinomonas primoryensis TaxID=178399 RepID=UPI0030D960B1|tara:strand:+ start:5623 stop:7044 length:1422 start_codon:yes stop_codon:yes gene_type:complete